ncbi:MAG: putative bifunctional diguanylate cyclase/phosphodiesterase, partial [Leptothrix ochracea]
ETATLAAMLKPSYATPVATDAVLSVLGRLHHPVWVFDIDRSKVVWANAGALEVWHAESLAVLSARDMATDMSESVAHRLRQFQQDFIRHDARFSEIWTLYPKGLPRTLRVMFSGMQMLDGRMAMLCEGLGEQQGDPETLRSAEALLHTTVMISLFERHGDVLYRNPAARDAVSDPTEALPAHFAEAQDLQALLDDVQRVGQGRRIARVKTSRGECWHEIAARACHDAVTGGEAVLFSEVDISELKQTEARAHYQSLHDPLTGLPNRHFVAQGFQARLDELRARGHQAALMFIDLDRFKDVNDSLGHAAGDALLMRVAERLRVEVRSEGLVARLGGDEFLVLVSAPDMATEAEVLSERLLSALSGTVQLDEATVRVTPSIGVCLFPRDGEDMDALMRHADLAMYLAKDQGRHRVAFFMPALNTAVQTRLALENELRQALQQQEFEVFYQPRLDVATGRLMGAEALVRWRHPERGLVDPGEFIPACEDSGQISKLGAWVLEQAARQQLHWRQRGWALNVSVNLSPCQFADPALLQGIQTIVRETGCNPQEMELEITESVLLGHDEHTVQVLNALRDMGFGISIDDFGTGYSNLAYLRHYPITVLKIDRSFVDEHSQARPITGLIVTLSRALGLRVVAEGVETVEQLDWLRTQGCDEFQGFLVSPPLSVTAFEGLLKACHPHPSVGAVVSWVPPMPCGHPASGGPWPVQ